MRSRRLLVGSAPISSTGGVLAAIDDDVMGIVLDARERWTSRARGLRPYPVVVVDTGSRLLGVTRTTLETVDLETGETVGPSPGVTGTRPSHVALSPDGAILAVADPATAEWNGRGRLAVRRRHWPGAADHGRGGGRFRRAT